MSSVSQKFPLPWWALALILLGGGGLSVLGGATGTRVAELPAHEPAPHLHERIVSDITDLDRNISDCQSMTSEHERRFQALEIRYDRFEERQHLIYTNQLLLCVKFDLECDRYAPR